MTPLARTPIDPLAHLPRPPCPWAYSGAPLTCDTLDEPTTYRARYDARPDRLDTFQRVCVVHLGGDLLSGKGGSMPSCAEHDAAVAAGWSILGMPGGAYAPGGALYGPLAGYLGGGEGGTAAPFLAVWGSSGGGPHYVIREETVRVVEIPTDPAWPVEAPAPASIFMAGLGLAALVSLAMRRT